VLISGKKFGFLCDCLQHLSRCGVISERLAYMDKEVFVSRRKDKAAAKLQRVFAQFVLFVSSGLCAAAGLHVVAPEKVKQGSMLQANGFVGFALFVDQERELDAVFLPEELGVTGVTQADHGDLCTFATELLLKFAQLRDMLPAEDSTVMAEKDQYCRAAFPQGAQTR